MTRLFIPGPTNVSPEVLAAQNAPMMGHRSAEFRELYARIQPKLQAVFQTRSRVYLAATSGSGLVEGALRSLVKERLLLCECGAFGRRWVEMAGSNGFDHDVLEAEWGEPNLPDPILEALQSGGYDTLVVVHNETSTGVVNPIAEIMARARAAQPDLAIVVDCVSSLGGVPFPTDELDVDAVVTSSQKCFALPPGLAFAAVSDRALERAAHVEHRGWYGDLLLLDQYHQRDYTPATPAISLLYALDLQLDRMLAEGLEGRFARHSEMAEMVRAWASERFELFAAEGHRSDTVTAVNNTLGLDIAALNEHLAQHDMTLANGYGRLRDRTFRIGHMGETRPSDIEQLLGYIEAFIG